MPKFMFTVLLYFLGGCAATTDPDDRMTPYDVGLDETNISLAKVCPISGQVPPRVRPEAFAQKIGGTVAIRVKVEGGKVVGVESISGPEVYFRPVVLAMQQYKCLVTTKAVYVGQRFEFKFE